MAEFICGTGLWGNAPKPGDPDNVLGLTATPAFGGINVEWTYPTTNPEGVAHFELYRSLNSDFATSVRQQIVNGTFFYDRILNDTSSTYYYWLRSVSVNGTRAEPIGPAFAIARPLIADLIQILSGRIDRGVLAQSLQAELNQIEDIRGLVATEVEDRLLDTQALQDAFASLNTDTLGTLSDFNDRILELLDADSLFVEELNNISGILSDADDRISNLRTELTQEDLRLDQKAGAIEDALNAAQQALELKDQELKDALDDNVNAFSDFRDVYATDKEATSSSITGILTRVDESESAIGTLTESYNTLDEAQASQFNSLSARLDTNEANFADAQIASADADTALGQRIDEQVTRVDDNVAEISSLSTTISNSTSALASRINELSAKLDATPTFASGFELGVDFDQWTVDSDSTLNAETGDVYAGSQSLLATASSSSVSAGAVGTGITAVVPAGTTDAFRGFDVTMRIWAKQPSSNASSQFALAYNTTDAGNSGWFYFTPTASWEVYEFTYSVPEGSTATNHEVKIWADTSGSGKAVLLDSLSVTQAAGELADVTAAIEEQQQALVDLEEALTSDFQSLASRVDGAESDIQTEASTRASELSAMSQLITNLGSSLDDAEAALTSLEQTQASESSALASRASSLETRMGDAESNITSLEESSTTLEESIATATSQLQSQIDANKSSITTEASTRSTAIDNTVSLITALRGEYEGTEALVANHSTLIQNNEDTIAQNVTAIQAARGDAESLVAAEEQARINAIAAEASRTNSLITRMGDAESSISSNESAISTETQARNQQVSAIRSEFEDADAALTSEIETVADDLKTETSRVTGALSRLDDAEAGLLAEASTRADETSALTSQVDSAVARLGTAEGKITSNRNLAITEKNALGQRIDGLQTTVDDNQATIISELETLTTDQEALATQAEGIEARYQEADANILTELNVQAREDEVLATSFSGLAVRVEEAEGRILNEQRIRQESDLLEAVTFAGLQAIQAGSSAVITQEREVRATENEAFASQITEVQSQLGDDFTAYKETIQTNIETINGKLQSIGALYTAQVQTNGLIGGFGIYNDGTEVQAGFDVDTFWVGRTSSDKVKPFIVQGGEVFINEAVINKLTFSKLTDEAGTFIFQNGKLQAEYIEVDQFVPTEIISSSTVSGRPSYALYENGDFELNASTSGGRVVQNGDGMKVYDGNTIVVQIGKL